LQSPVCKAACVCQRTSHRILAPAWLFAILLAIIPQLSPSQTSPKAAAPLRTLTTVKAVHTLSNAEAARALPVRLTAVIVYYDPFLNYPRRPIIMVTDGTASIYVALVDPPTPSLKAGALVEVTGESNPGDFGPNISNGHLRVIGSAPLPPNPPRQSMTHLLTGSEDAQWVELEAVVKSFEIVGGNVTLKLALADGEMAGTTVKEPGADYASLVDAKVVIHGIAGSLFNLHSQIFGLQLLFPNLAAVRIEQPAPVHPFQLPATPIRTLMQYDPASVFVHRVHIHGTATLFWPGRLICLQDGDSVKDNTEALCAQTAQTAPLTPGDLVDVIGFPQIGAVSPTLSDATFQVLPQRHTLAPASIDGTQAFSGVHDSQLVQMEGTVVSHDRASEDPTILVASGKYVFPVILPKSADAAALLALQTGSKVKINGICSVQADSRIFTRHDGYPVSQFFRIMLRSSSDIVVLKHPSWWTAEHSLGILVLALLLTLAILCWTAVLSVRVRRQSRLMEYQATHDGLTGIWNRKAVLDLMHREFEIAVRANQRLGVMMLDADDFKKVNDTYGHLAGDAVLKELARRIQDSVRTYDFTGRYGGEEFLIVLPGCFGAELLDRAERVRAAVANHPIQVEGAGLAITVSIGAAALDPLWNTEKDALASADSALYQAKHSGRNQVVSGNLLLDTPLTRTNVHSQSRPSPADRLA
jgi:diguanylate cyclase (GGDEF)-like protein